MKCIQLMLFIALSCVGIGAQGAEEYPAKSVTVIVPIAPGGPVDFVARALAKQVNERLGWHFAVENKPGATGIIGMSTATKAPPDGYTLIVAGSSVITSAPHLKEHLPYDAVTDIVPVVPLASYAYVIVANPKVPAKDLRALIALAKERPGMLAYGTAGMGSNSHLGFALFEQMAGVQMLHVPYQGSGPSFAALLAGAVDLVHNTPGIMVPYATEGRVRAIAVTGKERSPFFPGVPTVAEVLPGYEWYFWVGLFAPKGTPKEIIGLLNKEVTLLLMGQKAVKAWEGAGMEFHPLTPALFAAQVKREYQRDGELIKKLSLTPG